ncbi:hypothetical protein BU649_10645 [Staphylococcus chromogenes]|uniref:Uncharacterized protein n=1 Tax=Staphylococcus chromogenes TaxID=46126 RepID=A0ABX5I5E5_STACR|nr:hypothetical protein [Staphylococcus chromogenes]MCD9059201.1 hypothetical protein [Staphylococcus chromogenes]MDU0465823.1 hypothetical protein [Staphylococcus chromogenes]PTF48193.1 hypothetical protein BUY13_07885 [Staphylococcus chromogenes]PTG01808.1 hypothetical protein BU649_10645 [Staphylococcus chromogenes]PTG07388.1 hypothetical protein BU656_06650 [Staphylococcus chromogenes]
MTIGEMQDFLGDLYRDTYKGDTLIQINLVQMGWAIERLLDRGQITLFDDYDKVSHIVFDEINFTQRSRHDRS